VRIVIPFLCACALLAPQGASADVMFSGTATTVPTPGGNPSGAPNVFSIQSIGNTAGAISWTPSSPMTVSDLTNLSATYQMTNGSFGGGSPRFAVGVDDGGTTRYFSVYLGTLPNFTDTPPAGWNDTGNLLALGDNRIDLSQFAGGTFYDNYANLQNLLGGLSITEILLVLDGGWLGDQEMLVDSFSINDLTITAPEPASLITWLTLLGTGGIATCVRRRREAA